MIHFRLTLNINHGITRIVKWLNDPLKTAALWAADKKGLKVNYFYLLMQVIFIYHLSFQRAWSCVMNLKVSYELFPLWTDSVWNPKLGDACLLLSLILKRHDTVTFLQKMHPSAVHPGLVITAKNSRLDRLDCSGCCDPKLKLLCFSFTLFSF